MADKSIILVTGGNTGLGFAAVKALYASVEPHIVLMGSRSLDKANAAMEKLRSEIAESKSEVVPVQIDIEDDASIQSLRKEVESRYGRLDVLVNNAGISYEGFGDKVPTPAGIRKIFDHTLSVNITSTHAITHAFAPLILKSSQPRILFVTSGLASLDACAEARIHVIAEPAPKGWPKPNDLFHIAYRSSKTGLNMAMIEWQRYLKEDGVKLFCIDPGFLATDLGGVGADKLRQMGAQDPSVGGNLIKNIVEGKGDADAGKVLSTQGVQAW